MKNVDIHHIPWSGHLEYTPPSQAEWILTSDLSPSPLPPLPLLPDENGLTVCTRDCDPPYGLDWIAVIKS